MSDLRLQVPGGRMTVQSLRDLVGWAGAAGSSSLRLGDSQDWIVEGAAVDPGAAPVGFRRAETGSIQASTFGPAPVASVPWLTTGLWLDLLAQMPDPGPLDVQFVAEPALGHFVRHGHVRFVAGRASHRWELRLRRPGSDRVTIGNPVSTGDLIAEVNRARDSWAAGWGGYGEGPTATSEVSTRVEVLEGWSPEGRGTVRLGLAPPAGRWPVQRLRDLAWRAAEAGTVRISVTPGRVLLFEGLTEAEGERWKLWLEGSGVVTRHGDLDHAVVAAGFDPAAERAREEVIETLRRRDLLPPGPRLLVAHHALNRLDGVASSPYALLIRTPESWLYRSGDGSRAGEGNLDEVLAALAAPAGQKSASPVPEAVPSRVAASTHACPACLTVYDPVYGDPKHGIPAGIAFEELPDGWACPVCGRPRAEWGGILT